MRPVKAAIHTHFFGRIEQNSVSRLNLHSSFCSKVALFKSKTSLVLDAKLRKTGLFSLAGMSLFTSWGFPRIRFQDLFLRLTETEDAVLRRLRIKLRLFQTSGEVWQLVLWQSEWVLFTLQSFAKPKVSRRTCESLLKRLSLTMWPTCDHTSIRKRSYETI